MAVTRDNKTSWLAISKSDILKVIQMCVVHWWWLIDPKLVCIKLYSSVIMQTVFTVIIYKFFEFKRMPKIYKQRCCCGKYKLQQHQFRMALALPCPCVMSHLYFWQVLLSSYCSRPTKICVIHVHLLPYIIRSEFGTYRHELLMCHVTSDESVKCSVILKYIDDSGNMSFWWQWNVL
jgi:hypothetical protein